VNFVIRLVSRWTDADKHHRCSALLARFSRALLCHACHAAILRLLARAVEALQPWPPKRWCRIGNIKATMTCFIELRTEMRGMRGDITDRQVYGRRRRTSNN
jgi:hypothetical protein